MKKKDREVLEDANFHKLAIPKVVPLRCPVCNGFRTVGYDKLPCEVCNQRGIIWAPNGVYEKWLEKFGE